MKIIESYVDRWFTKLSEAIVARSYLNDPEAQLASYCFGYRGPKQGVTREDKILFSLNVLKTILETDAIKVSGTSEINADAVLPQEGTQEFEDMFNLWAEQQAYIKEKYAQEKAKEHNEPYIAPADVFTTDIYKTYRGFLQSTKKQSQYESKREYQERINALEQKKKEEFKQNFNKQYFISLSTDLTGHMRRDKWEFGIIVDFQHLGKDYMCSEEDGTLIYDEDGNPIQYATNGPRTRKTGLDFVDEVYTLDHPQLIKFDKVYKDTNGTIQLTFNGGMNAVDPSGNHQYTIPENVYGEVIEFLDFYKAHTPKFNSSLISDDQLPTKCDQAQPYYCFKLAMGPTLADFQSYIGPDFNSSELMRFLLDQNSLRGDSPFPEGEFRSYTMTTKGPDTVVPMSNNIIGVILPTVCRPLWEQDTYEIIPEIKALIAQKGLATVWVNGDRIIDMDDSPSAGINNAINNWKDAHPNRS